MLIAICWVSSVVTAFVLGMWIGEDIGEAKCFDDDQDVSADDR